MHAYLALTPRQRFPYHAKAHRLMDGVHHQQHCDPHAIVSPEHAARLFTPHQTPRERNLMARRAVVTSPDPVWLRTYYDTDSRPDLEETYAAMVGFVVGEGLVDQAGGGVLDDAGLYRFCDGDWACVLVRLPELSDVVRYGSKELYEERKREMDEGGQVDEDGGIEALDEEVVARVYLVDTEALEEGMVKVLWLDCHGECVWHNKVRAEEILDLTGAWMATASLVEIQEMYAESMEKGSRLRF